MHYFKSPFHGLRSLVVVLLILGIFFRIVNLDRKVYWGDEVYTSIRVSGYTTAEIVKTVTQAPTSAGELQKFQTPNPEKGVAGTIQGLAIEEPQLTPLYFVMLRSWVQWFGDSVTANRSLSVLLSIITLPCLYWFCLELFNSVTVGWIAIALISVSPLHLAYAQEARMYSFWILTLLLSGATLLRAMRSHTKGSWLLYMLATTVSLYTCLLSIVTLVGYGLYVLLITFRRQIQVFFAFLLTSIAGVLAFMPWLLIFFQHKGSGSSSSASAQDSLVAILKYWAGILSRGFVDFNLTSASPAQHLSLLTISAVLLLALIGYSFYFLVRHSPKRVWLFLLILIGGVPLAMMPRTFSANLPPRYLLSTYLGIQLAIAYLFANKITVLSYWKRCSWRIITVLVLTVGVLSCATSAQAEGWWNKQFSNCNPQIARTINQAKNPLVISDLEGGLFDHALSNMISLSHQLRSNVAFQILLPKSNAPKVSDRAQNIFVLTPSEHLRSSFEQTYKLEAVHSDSKTYRDTKNVCLWKINLK
jgi:uncharacterized membrane protein